MKNFYDFRVENIKDLSSEEKNLRKKKIIIVQIVIEKDIHIKIVMNQ